MRLTDADRLELANILVNVGEFSYRSQHLFLENGLVSDIDKLDTLVKQMHGKFSSSMNEVYFKQACDKDPELYNQLEMLGRDMVSVDLLREGTVYRRVRRQGSQRVCIAECKSQQQHVNNTYTCTFVG